MYITNINYSNHQEIRSIIAIKWLSWQDIKFGVLTADGDLSVFDVFIDHEDELADSISVVKIHQVQTFEELNHNFSFGDVNQLGN